MSHWRTLLSALGLLVLWTGGISRGHAAPGVSDATQARWATDHDASAAGVALAGTANAADDDDGDELMGPPLDEPYTATTAPFQNLPRPTLAHDFLRDRRVDTLVGVVLLLI